LAVKRGAKIVRLILAVLGLLMPLAAVQGCATQNEASRAEQAMAESEDGATCREKSGGDEEAYKACRKAMAEARAEQAAIQEQKRRDFDRVLGAGTDGQSSY
jgi:precorrin-3B methylase